MELSMNSALGLHDGWTEPTELAEVSLDAGGKREAGAGIKWAQERHRLHRLHRIHLRGNMEAK